MNLKQLKLPNNVLYSPLAGCSDYPFRQMAAKWQPGLMYCEMVKMEAVVRRVPQTERMLAYHASMRPIGAQLCGSQLNLAGESAKILEDLGFDVIDFNCGCPVDKITKDGSGSGMLKNPELIGEIIAEMCAAVKVPVTVKIRAGWSESEIVVEEITQIAEQAGAAAIAVHGRTRKQAYRGPANWEWIKRSVNAAKTIKVIGNGDVFSPEAAKNMLETTGCDAVLVSRGTFGNPWIAQDIVTFLNGKTPPDRPFSYRMNTLIEHFENILQFKEERVALKDIRRVGCWYLNNTRNAAQFRQRICKSSTVDEVRTILNEALHAD